VIRIKFGYFMIAKKKKEKGKERKSIKD